MPLTGLEIAGIIASATSAVSGGVSAAMGVKSVKKQKRLMKAQDEINDENYAKQLADQRQMIDEARQYDSIGARMRRARSAGVSPIAELGASSGSSAVGASAPTQSGVTIPTSDPAVQAMANASSSFAQAESSLRGALLGDTQRRSDEMKLSLAQATFDAKVAQENHLAESLKNQAQLYTAQTDKTSAEAKCIATNEQYLQSLTNRTNTLTPLEADNLAQDYMTKMLGYFNMEMDLEIKQNTLPAQVMQYFANLGLTLTASELNRANSFGSIENAKSNRLNAYANILGVAEQYRHNVTSEDLQRTHEDNLKKFNEMTIEIQGGNLDQRKVEMWMQLAKQVSIGAAGAALGFFVAGPLGAAYGASIGLGANIAVPAIQSNSQSSNGFGRYTTTTTY